MDQMQLPGGSQSSVPVRSHTWEIRRDSGTWDRNRENRVDLVDTFLFMDSVGRMVLSIAQTSALSLGKKSQDVQRSAKGPRWQHWGHDPI